MERRDIAGSAAAAFELQRENAEERFLDEIAAAFSESGSNPPSVEACPRKDVSHETIELPQQSSSSSSCSSQLGSSAIESVRFSSTLDNSSDTPHDLSASTNSSNDDDQVLIARMAEKLDFGNIPTEFHADKISSPPKLGSDETSKGAGIGGYVRRIGSCAGFLNRTRRALQQRAGAAARGGSKRSKTASVRRFTGQGSGTASTKVSYLMSIPVSEISQEVFSKAPSKNELKNEFELMRNPFPNVPKYIGNPPWLTKYHPDLVKPPARA